MFLRLAMNEGESIKQTVIYSAATLKNKSATGRLKTIEAAKF